MSFGFLLRAARFLFFCVEEGNDDGRAEEFGARGKADGKTPDDFEAICGCSCAGIIGVGVIEGMGSSKLKFRSTDSSKGRGSAILINALNSC
mmetsp:Transcript_18280/g.20568  ORF Transcript_18280/g.20568 Transcript_18280/m.20568 type:complete len:92 (-) Transcript_18280:73-348(-)